MEERPATDEQGTSSRAPTDPTARASEDETPESLRAQLEEERNRANGFLTQWQRAAADYQNLKRRTEEDQRRGAMYANVALVMNLLPVYDDLNRALEAAVSSADSSSWVEGVRQITRKFQGALEAGGVKDVPAEPGMDFDPNVHQAVTEAPGEAGKITKVFEKGYTMGDRLLRPSMVVVGNGS